MGEVDIASLDHRQDHADQAEALAVFRAENAAHAVRMQIGNLSRHDHAAAAAEHFDVRAAALFQQIDHVLEVFDVPALIARQRNPLRIFLQGGGNDIVDRAVMSEVDHLCAIRHQDTAHDVDRGVVTVEERGCRYKTHLVGGFVFGQLLGDG